MTSRHIRTLTLFVVAVASVLVASVSASDSDSADNEEGNRRVCTPITTADREDTARQDSALFPLMGALDFTTVLLCHSVTGCILLRRLR